MDLLNTDKNNVDDLWAMCNSLQDKDDNDDVWYPQDDKGDFDSTFQSIKLPPKSLFHIKQVYTIIGLHKNS